MEKTEAFVTGFIAVMIAGVLLGVSGFVYLNAQDNKSKDKQQFSQCVDSGKSYIKTPQGPICIK